jgi:two-component system NtrC family sensor kinase
MQTGGSDSKSPFRRLSSTGNIEMKDTVYVNALSVGSDHDSIQKTKWHLVYSFLAAFDIFTVLFSLGLTHRLMEVYDNSVEVNQQWSARLLGYMQTSNLAATVNLPGNNVFKSGDVEIELENTVSAKRHFGTRMSQARAELEANVSHEQVRLSVRQHLDSIDTARHL